MVDANERLMAAVAGGFGNDYGAQRWGGGDNWQRRGRQGVGGRTFRPGHRSGYGGGRW